MLKSGASILCELPLCVLETAESQTTSGCCSSCMRYLGDVEQQFQASCMGSRTCRLSPMLGSLCCRSSEATSETCVARYCSTECRDYAHCHWHLLECPNSNEESDAMAEFAEHARNADELYLAVRRVICRLILQNISAVLTCESSQRLGASDLLGEFDQAIARNPELPKIVQQNMASTVEWFNQCFPGFHQTNNAPVLTGEPGFKDSVSESWLLLYSALASRGISAASFGPLLSREFFGTVLTALERYAHYVCVGSSPIPQRLIEYVTTRTAEVAAAKPPEEAYLRQLINPAAYQSEAVLQELLADKLLLVTELSALQNNADSIARAAGLPADQLFRLKARDFQCVCIVLAPYTAKIAEHSCIPNVQVNVRSAGAESGNELPVRVELPTLQGPSGGGANFEHRSPLLELTATRSFDASCAPFCLSYGEEAESEGGSGATAWLLRQTHLAAKFQLSEAATICECALCRYERTSQLGRHCADPAEANIDNGDLLAVGHAYMQQGRFADAERAYCTVARRWLGESFDAEDINPIALATVQTTVQCCQDEEQARVLGDAFHALGAACLESGDWQRGRKLWRTGAAICAGHEQLRGEVTKLDCFPTVSVDIVQAPTGSEASTVEAGKSIVSRRTHTQVRIEHFGEQLRDEHYRLTMKDTLKHASLPPFLRIHSGQPGPSAGTAVHLTAPASRLLSAQECQWIIDTTEAHAATRGGWTTSRHYAVPTTDIPVHVIQSTATLAAPSATPATDGDLPVLSWFNGLFRDRLAPLLATQFQGDFNTQGEPIHVAVHDAFVVKYDAGPSSPADEQGDGALPPVPRQTYLPLHCDQSSHSFTIALNSCEDYEGGGTFIPALGGVFRPDAGQVLSFPGGTLLHGGEPVTRGRRYILAVFAYLAGSKPVIRTQLANHSGDGIPTKVENGDNTRKRPTQEVCLGFGGVQWKAHKPNEAEEANSAGVSGGLFNFSF